jgi:hypothetical protein
MKGRSKHIRLIQIILSQYIVLILAQIIVNTMNDRLRTWFVCIGFGTLFLHERCNKKDSASTKHQVSVPCKSGIEKKKKA